jgi:hypothetical protein
MVMSEKAMVEAMMVAARIQRSVEREIGGGEGVLFMAREISARAGAATEKLRHAPFAFPE